MKLTTKINCQKEVIKITTFIKTTVYSAGFSKVIVPLSGGVDSATTAFLAVKALGIKNALIVRLPYQGLNTDRDAELVIKKLKIPETNVFEINIQPVVDLFWKHLNKLSLRAKRSNLGRDCFVSLDFARDPRNDDLRLGNLMARVRMIIIYDLAKANQAMVCGTENKSEHLLGYYTLHGDSASDLEPIRYLYKTQVRELAKFLGVPEKIIAKPPTAGLWKGQTDEGELGFSYQEADQILSLFFDKKYPQEKIIKMGFKKNVVKKVFAQVEKNSFKEKLPYLIFTN